MLCHFEKQTLNDDIIHHANRENMLSQKNNVGRYVPLETEKIYFRKISAKIMNKQFNRTHCGKWSAVFFLVLPGSAKTQSG